MNTPETAEVRVEVTVKTPIGSSWAYLPHSTSLDELICTLQTMLRAIPEEHQTAARFRVDTTTDEAATWSVTYSRPETDVERRLRLQRIASTENVHRESRRRLYEQLREEFGEEASAKTNPSQN